MAKRARKKHNMVQLSSKLTGGGAGVDGELTKAQRKRLRKQQEGKAKSTHNQRSASKRS